LTIVVALNIPIIGFAEDVSNLKNQVHNKQIQIDATDSLLSDYYIQRKQLSESVISLNDKLKNTKEEIEKLEIRLDEITVELNKAKANEDEKKRIFHNRLRAMYESGNDNNFEKILNSDDLMTATRKAEIIRQISESDKKVFDEMSAIRENIDKIKADYQINYDEQQKLQKELDKELNENNAQINELDKKIKETKELKKSLSFEKKKIEEEIYKRTFWGKVETEAKKYLGYPYVWGGSTPETSFDCSGFVCWALNKSGAYKIDRTSAQGIYNRCNVISKEEAMPGDIIFFTETYNAGEPVSHVGFYVGDNKMLHCGSPIQYTRIDTDYWKKHFYAFGRLKNIK